MFLFLFYWHLLSKYLDISDISQVLFFASYVSKPSQRGGCWKQQVVMPSMSYQSSTPTAWCIIYTITLLWAFSNNKITHCRDVGQQKCGMFDITLLGRKKKILKWPIVKKLSFNFHCKFTAGRWIGGKSGLESKRRGHDIKAKTHPQVLIMRETSCRLRLAMDQQTSKTLRI